MFTVFCCVNCIYFVSKHTPKLNKRFFLSNAELTKKGEKNLMSKSLSKTYAYIIKLVFKIIFL